jgi:hypothetical protein
MRWLCIFRACRWIWHFNADDVMTGDRTGVYQCSCCKTISIGSPR